MKSQWWLSQAYKLSDAVDTKNWALVTMTTKSGNLEHEQIIVDTICYMITKRIYHLKYDSTFSS